MASGPITSWEIDGETVETVRNLILGGSKNHCWWCLQPWKSFIFTLAPWKKSYDQPRQHIKKQRHYFANNGLSSQSYGFSSGHVWMSELDYQESWAPKNWCFWTVVLEKTLESPLDCVSLGGRRPSPSSYFKWSFLTAWCLKEAAWSSTYRLLCCACPDKPLSLWALVSFFLK